MSVGDGTRIEIRPDGIGPGEPELRVTPGPFGSADDREAWPADTLIVWTLPDGTHLAAQVVNGRLWVTSDNRPAIVVDTVNRFTVRVTGVPASFECTLEHPYTGNDPGGVSHDHAVEVPGTRAGNVVTMHCPVCGKRWKAAG